MPSEPKCRCEVVVAEHKEVRYFHVDDDSSVHAFDVTWPIPCNIVSVAMREGLERCAFHWLNDTTEQAPTDRQADLEERYGV